jgi:hypothetical protein
MPDVLPSIIVLAITTLLVFRREVTIPRANKGAPRTAAARPSTARELQAGIAKAACHAGHSREASTAFQRSVHRVRYWPILRSLVAGFG